MKIYGLELKGYGQAEGRYGYEQRRLLKVIVAVSDGLSDVVTEEALAQCHNRPDYVEHVHQIEYLGQLDTAEVPCFTFKASDVTEATLGAEMKSLRRLCASRILRSDEHSNAEELDCKYNPEGDGEHPVLRRWDWRQQVASQSTVSGYWQWVEHQIHDRVRGLDFSVLLDEFS